MSSSRLSLILFLLVAAAHEPVSSQDEWTLLPVGVVGDRGDAFSGVDGTASDDVWAVGAWEPPFTDGLSLIHHFDGRSWTKFPTPDTGVIGPEERLDDVIAISPQSAIAVGAYTPEGHTPQPLAMEWNGSGWALMPAPVFEGGAVFRAIDQSPSGEIWVAGFLYGSAFLAQRNGGGWDIAYSPQVGGERNNFHDLDARSDTEIWAVGTHSNRMGQRMLLIQRYDGNGSWTTFDIPSPGGLDEFTGVRAFAANDVWAIGYYYDRVLFRYQPMIMHYDGAGWTRAQVPTSPGSARPECITALAPDDVYVAGTFAPDGGVQGPLMLHYDGSGWTDVPMPPSGGSYEWFLGLGTTPDGAVWVVGQYYDGATMEPVAFYNPRGVTAIGESGSAGREWLGSSVPNPFRSGTALRIFLDRSGPVRLDVWNVSGRLVRTLAGQEMGAGSHVVHWDGRDALGRPVAAGVYFYDLSFRGRRVARQEVVRLR